MPIRIRYTRHAQEKFATLERHGFPITAEQVQSAVTSPDRLIPQGGRLIAQSRISDTHVLRVVYREEGDERVVITFYPGRRARYED
jgi:hypothetical protein